jgi:hypothetical protein
MRYCSIEARDREGQPVVERTVIFATIICSHTSNPTVGRFVWNGQAYSLVGASKQRPGSILPDDGARSTKSAFEVSPSYRCPGCGASSYVQCGRCRGLGCWDPTWEMFRCPLCGNAGAVNGTIDRISGLSG